MYIYQDGKLYVQDGDKLVGVEIYSDKIIKVEGTETVLGDDYMLLTPYEVWCKFNITEGHGYKFPVEKKVVKEEVADGGTDTTGKAKGTTRRKSTAK